ncbi:hypothetical protein T492DRAFT_945261 [Pavlovales sp. CCMP2436]|nr:hypothetical protein T492DRAFT_945261 [Pavlovales sp. CCMP2436]
MVFRAPADAMPQEAAHRIPGYTGFIPASQHVLAMTFGQASAHLLNERTANDDPAKWRKHVSYAEFTPPRTPIEKHHIPGYSGFVPGVVADSGQLFGKTFGKMTLKAIKGGYEETEDSNLTVEKEMLAYAAQSLPDFEEGGSSWAGASPFRADLEYEVGTIQPHQPQSWGLATGAEPWRESALLERMRAKGNRNQEEKPSALSRPSTAQLSANLIDEASGVIPYKPRTELPLRHSQFETTARPDLPTRISKHVPGYTGFIPGVISESIEKVTAHLYRTTSSLEFGEKDRLVKTAYPKNPLPDFVHFGSDLEHPSLYNGYQAM